MTFASRKRPELMHWTMAECERCDLMFAVDPPPFDSLRGAYAAADFDSMRESDAAARTYEAVVQTLALDRLGWDRGQTRVLDVGCGDGAFLLRMKEAGAREVVGIEISEEPVRRASPAIRGHIERCMVEEYAGRGFNIATGFQVWEHFSDPLAVMRSLGQFVVPGGVVIGVVHDRHAVANRMMGRKSPIWDVEHLQLFSRHSIAALVEAAGLTFIGAKHISNAYAADYWLRLAPLPSAVDRMLRHVARPAGREVTIPLRVGNLAFVAQRPVLGGL